MKSKTVAPNITVGETWYVKTKALAGTPLTEVKVVELTQETVKLRTASVVKPVTNRYKRDEIEFVEKVTA